MARFLDWLGFIAIVYGPHSIVASADKWFGRWCLRRAGAYVHGYRAGRE